MILAYETATDICSVSFQNKNGEIFEKKIQGRSVHSDNVFLFTQELMKEHNFSIEELEAVLVSNGPGSYTGLRIVASAIKGILFQSKVKLFEVNTLAGFAQSVVEVPGNLTVHSIIDARRTHIYHQSFSANEKLIRNSEMSIKEIIEFEEEITEGDYVIGTGINRLSESTLEKVSTYGSGVISASNLIHLFSNQPNSQFFKETSSEALNPNYISSSQVNNS
tara:strand:+ start:39356 stop:40018 length:663 start_codon:yes stop_codon:yes gene_type:complete